jgi:2,4'-dihydroxyacetophenone dioxygenase
MNDLSIPNPSAPLALHRGADELPFVSLEADGTMIRGGRLDLQLLQVDIEGGLWVVRTRFAPGTTVQQHKHTGEVFAVTCTGSWYYLEYPDSVNRAGSYLFEPAGSVHTLYVPETNTEVTDVWFAIRGANLNLDSDGNVASVLDAGAVLDLYLGRCAEMGVPRPRVIGI